MLAMRAYELMIIFQGDVEDDALNRILAQGGKLIEAGSGRVAKTDRWGKRRFAYEVKHQWEGFYVLIEATAEPIAMSELDRALHLADEVVRHKVIRLPDDVAGRTVRTTAPAAESDEATPETTPAAARSEQ
jgi:small subunit ribosomal protein S6